MIKDLVYIATELDRRGLIKEASFVDSLLFKYSEGIVGNALGGVSRGVGNVDEALAPVRDVAGRAEGVLKNTNKIVSTALGFIEKLFSGDANFATKILNTEIPGVAFVGQLLRLLGRGLNLPAEVSRIAGKVKNVWDEVYRIVKQKIDTGTFGRACISAADLGGYKSQFLLGLLTGPAAVIIKGSYWTAEKLDSLGLTSFSDISVCIGEDLKGEAKGLVTNMETAAVEWNDKINEYIALNTHRESGDTAFA